MSTTAPPEKVDASILVPSNASTTDHNPSTIPDHSNDAAEQLRRMSKEEYDEFERKLLRKIDRRMVPWLT